MDNYGRDHPAIADPKSIFWQGYSAARDLKINMTSFRKMIVEAMKLIGKSPFK